MSPTTMSNKTEDLPDFKDDIMKWNICSNKKYIYRLVFTEADKTMRFQFQETWINEVLFPSS